MGAFRHMTFTDRAKIELCQQEGWSARKTARAVGVHVTTIYRELERGTIEHINPDNTTEMRYSAHVGQERYEQAQRTKGAPSKIKADPELLQFIEDKIKNDKYSPAAVIGEIKTKGLEFSTSICEKTIYNSIARGVFPNLTNQNLPTRSTPKRRYRKVRPAAPNKESIENRPAEVEARTTFGQWEMDTVVGNKRSKAVLLVLTERLTRYEIIIGLPDKTTASVVNALDTLEREYGPRFPEVFQSITVDNGREFSDSAGIERSCLSGEKRTKLYYCHAYCCWERGSNENANKLIRRHIPKGSDIGKWTADAVKQLETWVNQYPRELHDYATSATLFHNHQNGQ